MIKLKLSQIVFAVQSKALDKIEDAIPPGAYRFRCARLTEAVLTVHQRWKKQELDAVRKWGVANKDTGLTNVMDPANSRANVEAFEEAMRSLLDAEVEIDADPISFDLIGKEAQDLLTVKDVRCLGPLIVER
jgi:hypothetical protein